MSPRDTEYEALFLREAGERAERRHGVGSEGFALAVKRRLQMGQERYGNEWLEKCLPQEALEEAWDAAAYAVLDAQKMLASDEDQPSRAFHLFEIAVHACAIDFHARQLRSSDG